MKPEQHADYVVQCIREAASMYEDGARQFLAEHDAHVRAAALNEGADAIDDMERRNAWPVRPVDSGICSGFLRGMAAGAGEQSSREAAADATPRPTIYQASHDSIVMGWHTTIDAARVRCEAHASRNPHLTGLMNWVLHEPLEDDSAEELTVDDAPTGYVVTPLEVASKYDEEADE